MKKRLLPRLIILLTAVTGTGFADTPVRDVREVVVRREQPKEVTVFVTGSLIPQRVRLEPVGTKTSSPVRVIDRREIDSTGRRTTVGILLNDPSVRIIGFGH